MTALVAAVVKVGRWHVALPCALLLLGLSWWQSGTAVIIPLVDWLVPVPLLAALVTTTVCLAPLYSSLARLEHTFVRGRRWRSGQVAAALGLAAVACAPAVVVDPPAGRLVALLVAAGIGAVVALGDSAWVVAVALGFLGVFADGGVQRPLSAALGHLPVLVVAAAPALAAVAYVLWGPRESRRGR